MRGRLLVVTLTLLALASSLPVDAAPLPVLSTRPCGPGALPLLSPGANDAGAQRDATYEDPVHLGAGTSWACLDQLDETDWFTLDVPVGEPFLVRILAQSPNSTECLDIDIVLEDDQGARLAQSFGPCGTEDGVAWQADTPTSNLRIGVDRWSGEGDYTITLDVGAPQPRPCADAVDHGGWDATPARRLDLAWGETVTGCIDRYDLLDDYNLRLDQPGAWTLAFTPTDCNRMAVVVDDVHGARVGGAYVTCETATISRWSYGGEVHRVRIGELRYLGNYTLTLTPGGVTPPACHPQDDGGSGRDATRASPVALAGAVAGCLDDADKIDAYAFDLVAGQTATLRLETATCLDFELHVLAPSGAAGGSSTQPGCSSEEVTLTAAESGTFSALPFRWSGDGDYTLTLEVGA